MAKLTRRDELLWRHAAGERDFSDTDLSGADLSGADLSGAMLSRADLTGANLTGANLTGANLSLADLFGANLTGVDLTGANLCNADLRSADLRDAKSDAATEIGWTALTGVDVTAFCVGGVTQLFPSVIDYETVVKSLAAPQLKAFLRRSGMPDVFVEYMVDCARSLDSQQVFSLLRSTFISYGGPDEPFARKLNAALEAQGVTTFFFKDDAAPGERLHRVMRKGVNEHDRVILICSQASLDRPGLLNELEETLAREARDAGNAYLIPVRLDDYVINGWSPSRSDLAQAVRDRVISDFRNHEDGEVFRSEVAKLIAVLKVPPKVVSDA